MSAEKAWGEWDGQGYPASKVSPIVYYFPGKVDIESSDRQEPLVETLHMDGVAPTKVAARKMLDNAVVVHGQVVDLDGELHCYFGPTHGYDEDGYNVTHEATWVELDEYEDE